MDVRVHYAPHRNSDGRILGALAIMEDVTELRDAEKEHRRLEGALQQAQKMEAVGTLAGGIAHDFNNLLTGICGGLELGLLDVPQDSVAAENLRHAGTAAERAMELTQQLLTLSRRQEPTMAPTDVNEVVDRIGRLLRRSIPEVIQVRTVLGPGMPTIRADAGQLEQALLNLGINARDAIADGQGEISFATEAVEVGEAEARLQGSVAPGSYIRVTVTDSGVGMAADVVDRAFEPFYTTKDQGKGTGLGLAMVYTCVKAHEGWVDVESAPGTGTSIRLHLPLIELASLSRAEGEKQTPHGDEIILLVDDQETVLRVGRRMLERCGYEVVTARDGREALERFAERQTEIALVLADLMMPRCDGRDLLKGLRARGSAVPVVLASG
ncbi:MAG: response regulator [bacterium]|nr:response regulator [bacterium]